VAVAAVTPGFLAWLLDGCPRLTSALWLGPSIPWVITPSFIMLALGGWMATRKTGVSRETSRPWYGKVNRTVPVLIAAALIVVYQFAYFSGISLLPPGG
jgi:hypothetical protein